jgi:hypothetical protein
VGGAEHYYGPKLTPALSAAADKPYKVPLILTSVIESTGAYRYRQARCDAAELCCDPSIIATKATD